MNTDICGIEISPIVKLIGGLRNEYTDRKKSKGWYWCTWFDIEAENTVLNVMPKGTTGRRARAFMKLLDTKLGLATGCHCGCRGDYELTPKGWK